VAYRLSRIKYTAPQFTPKGNSLRPSYKWFGLAAWFTHLVVGARMCMLTASSQEHMQYTISPQCHTVVGFVRSPVCRKFCRTSSYTELCRMAWNIEWCVTSSDVCRIRKMCRCVGFQGASGCVEYFKPMFSLPLRLTHIWENVCTFYFEAV
jgi:hypothetical protein